MLFTLGLPLSIAALVWVMSGTIWPAPVRIALALLLVMPIAPLLDRLVFRPVADGGVLLLLILAVALHFALAGIGLMFFGSRGRAHRYADRLCAGRGGRHHLRSDDADRRRGHPVQRAALCLLQHHAHRQGALRHGGQPAPVRAWVGIRPDRAGTTAYLIGSVMAGISGILIAPVNTVFYDTGFLLGLLAFVGAIIGGMTNYPLTVARGDAGGTDGELHLLLQQRLQGGAGVLAADPSAALAVADNDAFRGRNRGMTTGQARLVALAVLVLLALAPVVVDPFTVTLLNYIGVYSLAALGLVLLTGIGGIVSFGQAAFVGIAAYATAWLTTVQGASPWARTVVCLRRDLRRGGAAIVGGLTLRLTRALPVA